MADAQPFSKPRSPLRIAALISGGGTTVLNLHDRIVAGQLDAAIGCVVSSSPSAKGNARCADVGLHVAVVDRKRFNTPAEFSDAVFDEIRGKPIDLVCLAGFLSLLVIPDDFAGRVINIHPALLPSFGGRGMFGHHVHEAVIAHGCKVSGCTVHFADATYDTGPIIVQRTCPVEEDDTPDDLAARVFEQECIAYPQAIELLAAGRIQRDGRRVHINPK